MTCEYVPVSKWDNVDVCMWINGLSEMLSQHVSQFKLHSITGCDLLKLSRQQLLYLKVNQLGHQELLLEAVELLALVDNARSRQSTISLASALSKTTSQLIKALTDFEKVIYLCLTVSYIQHTYMYYMHFIQVLFEKVKLE
jgi:connector enhancer of kinase suppressor of Ras 2